ILATPSPACSNTLSLHDALPILFNQAKASDQRGIQATGYTKADNGDSNSSSESSSSATFSSSADPDEIGRVVYKLVFPSEEVNRSEEHTSELQSRFDLVCRLLLE